MMSSHYSSQQRINSTMKKEWFDQMRKLHVNIYKKSGLIENMKSATSHPMMMNEVEYEGEHASMEMMNVTTSENKIPVNYVEGDKMKTTMVEVLPLNDVKEGVEVYLPKMVFTGWVNKEVVSTGMVECKKFYSESEKTKLVNTMAELSKNMKLHQMDVVTGELSMYEGVFTPNTSMKELMNEKMD